MCCFRSLLVPKRPAQCAQVYERSVPSTRPVATAGNRASRDSTLRAAIGAHSRESRPAPVVAPRPTCTARGLCTPGAPVAAGSARSSVCRCIMPMTVRRGAGAVADSGAERRATSAGDGCNNGSGGGGGAPIARFAIMARRRCAVRPSAWNANAHELASYSLDLH